MCRRIFLSFSDHVRDNSGCDCAPICQCSEVNLDLWKQKHVLGRSGNISIGIYTMEYWWEKMCLYSLSNKAYYIFTDSHFCHGLVSFREKSSMTLLKPFSQLHGWWHVLTGGKNIQNFLLFIVNLLTLISFQDMLLTWRFNFVFTTDWNTCDRSLYILSTVWALV